MPLSSIEKNNLLALVGALSTKINTLTPDNAPPPPDPTITGLTATPPSLPIGGGNVSLAATYANVGSVVVDGVTYLPSDFPKTFPLTATHAFSIVAKGAAGTTDATASITVNVATGALAWSKLYQSPGGGPGSFDSWFNLAWDDKRNVAYAVSWGRAMDKFDPATNIWSNVVPAFGPNDFHNRTIVCEDINDRMWCTDGTGTGTGGWQFVDLNNPAAGFVLHSTGGPSYESAVFLDKPNKRMVAFGGWSSWNAEVATFALQPIGAGWINANVAGGPSFPWDFTKQTMQRSFKDTLRNRLGYVDLDGSLWFLSLTPTMAWTHITVPGQAPAAYCQFDYHAGKDMIIGWSASSMIAQGATNAPPTQETWLCPLSAPAWTKGANAVAGDTVPPIVTFTGYDLCYDPTHQQMLCHTGVGAGSGTPQTWGLL